ncbi:MAG: hypothetical protein ABI427_17665, partial [Solirubrobacteraceae bacterium]
MIDLAERFPRPFSEREEAILRLMLSVDGPGIGALREQADAAMVVGRCSCGCATVDLAVDRSRAPRSLLTQSPIVETQTKPGAAEHNVPVDVLLFLDDGWLSSLEIVYFDDAIPDEFPPPA